MGKNIQDNPMKKWTKDLNRLISKQDIQMGRKHMKSCSTLLVIRKMQIKRTMRFHFPPTRVAIIFLKRGVENNKCWQGCEEIGTIIQQLPKQIHVHACL